MYGDSVESDTFKGRISLEIIIISPQTLQKLFIMVSLPPDSPDHFHILWRKHNFSSSPPLLKSFKKISDVEGRGTGYNQ